MIPKSVRQAASVAIGKFGSAAAGAVPALMERLGDEYHDVRLAALEAIGKIGRQAIEVTPGVLQRLRNLKELTGEHLKGRIDEIDLREAEALLRQLGDWDHLPQKLPPIYFRFTNGQQMR